jgi:hypothetical protein
MRTCAYQGLVQSEDVQKDLEKEKCGEAVEVDRGNASDV